MRKFIPTYRFDKVYDISVEFLKENNIQGVMLDVDNTLIDGYKVMPEKVKKWLSDTKKAGIVLCLLSNSFNSKAIQRIRGKYDIYGIGYAKKPLKKGFNIALNIMGIDKDKCVIIGDQLLTDIYGANRIGMRSVLVEPITKKEAIITRIKRPLERIILKKGENKK